MSDVIWTRFDEKEPESGRVILVEGYIYEYIYDEKRLSWYCAITNGFDGDDRWRYETKTN